jgi:hypothetical protein
LKRRAVLAFFQKLPVCLVGIEACASSHYWSRGGQPPLAGFLGSTCRLPTWRAFEHSLLGWRQSVPRQDLPDRMS